jgi:hypothetical protein
MNSPQEQEAAFLNGDVEKLTVFADQSVRAVVQHLKKYRDPKVREFCGYLDATQATYPGRLVTALDEQPDASILLLSGNYTTNNPGLGFRIHVAVQRDPAEIVKVDIGKDKDLQLQLLISTILIQPSVYNTLWNRFRTTNLNSSDSIQMLTNPWRFVIKNTLTGWEMELSKFGEVEVPPGSKRWYDCFAGHKKAETGTA